LKSARRLVALTCEPRTGFPLTLDCPIVRWVRSAKVAWMLQKREQIQLCFDGRLMPERKADETADPARKAGFLEMEKRCSGG
jgi:hypothetical protein